jgi:hypothetical protein
VTAAVAAAVVSCFAAMAWWESKRRKGEQSVQFFEDQSLNLWLHFPSMASVSYSLFPLVYCGEAQRLDGPRWLTRYLPLKDAKTAAVREPEWAQAQGSLGSRIEAAYQRYLALPATAATNTQPRWFYEMARDVLHRMHKQECTLVGID